MDQPAHATRPLTRGTRIAVAALCAALLSATLILRRAQSAAQRRQHKFGGQNRGYSGDQHLMPHWPSP